ncbi:hypothetical protein GGU10DRAFT_53387 [Lentinula aff. detonsa]|uniref:Uncharacterized protein n=1 Tax=Lentinula aff. detonsa TaxID=2804958 RepID=A0AA38KV45_9AGAR|nr:hypothetical protein GGU10DRAFT_53387 [Lentinula aff. detonsa]
MSLDEGSTSHPVFINPSYFQHIRRSNKWACTLCIDANKKRKPMSYREAIQHERNSADHAFLVKAQLFQQPQQQQNTQPSAWDQSFNPWEAQGVSVEAWFPPATEDATLMSKEQLRGKDHQYFADQVDDMVPFWIRGIEAAERGEVLKLEEFLNSLDNETWPPRGPNPWAHIDRHSTFGGRAAREPTTCNNDVAKWIVESVSSVSAESGRSTRRADGDALPTASHDIRSKSTSVRNSNPLVEIIARQNAADEKQKQRMYTFFELPTNEKVKKIDDLIRSLHSS